jgi:nitroreductase
MTHIKEAASDHPIHEFVAKRWSAYAYDPRPVAWTDLQSIFEAARWAPSSRNEQPWAYVVAVKDQKEEFEKLLSCLVESNQQWARAAPVLALGVMCLNLSRNNQPNRHAAHDLGLASATLTFEATARGLVVHQMGGILPDKAREIYEIPEGWEVMTALAMGYPGQAESLPEPFRQRDLRPRSRKPLEAFIFGKTWDTTAGFVRRD